MRIQGELLKLGVGVSATTVATVLRSSGLGPAPRRLGPSWSEFLRAQAHSMLGGDLSAALADSSAAGKDGLEGSAPEPIRSARDGSGGQVEADDNLSPVNAAEARHAYQPPPARNRSARPLPLPTTRAPLRLQPPHRSHARDGPPRAGPRSCPTAECFSRHVTAVAGRAPCPHQPRVRRIGRLPRPSAPRRQRNRSTRTPSRRFEPTFFTPHAGLVPAFLGGVVERPDGVLDAVWTCVLEHEVEVPKPARALRGDPRIDETGSPRRDLGKRFPLNIASKSSTRRPKAGCHSDDVAVSQ